MARARVLIVLLFFAAFTRPAIAARSDDLRRAKLAAAEAFQLCDEQRFAEAAQRFLDAYELSREPIQLRNAAKAFEVAQMTARALEHWQKYARLAANDRQGLEEAREHIAGLEGSRQSTVDSRQVGSGAEPQPEPEAQPAPAAIALRPTPPEVVLVEPAPVAEPNRTPGYVAIAGGVAMLTAGAVLWIIAGQNLSNLEQRLAVRDGSGRISGISRTDAATELAGVNTQRTASGLLTAAGLATIGIGASITWIEW